MKKTDKKQNYLEKIPQKNHIYTWKTDADGLVTLEIQNKGVMNRIAQRLFKKPKVSYVHLDEFGSFVWCRIDGKTDITAIGVCVDEHFGEKAHPLYERLAKFFMVLESYGFVQWVTTE